MAARLISLDQDDIVVALEAGEERVLGRQKDLKIADRNVSRDHCIVTYSTGEASPVLLLKANKKTYLVKRGSKEYIIVGPSESAQV